MSKSIKDLVGGKSTLQNELLVDLQLDFTSAPEKGEELLLEELGSALDVVFANGLISRLIGGKTPGGFNVTTIKSYLSKTWGLGPSRADGVLLLWITMEPAKRSDPKLKSKLGLTALSLYTPNVLASLFLPAALEVVAVELLQVR